MSWSPNTNALRGRVAVVAGATRGAGRGIAAARGEAGATVVCTGRSTRRSDSPTRSDYDRPETIEETAELVTQLGGVGIPIVVDHLDKTEVGALADKIRAEHGRIDLLVNDIWGAEILKGGPAQWNTPIWKLDLEKGLRILRLGIAGDVSLPPAAPDRAARRIAGRGHGRNGRIQRQPLSAVGVLRPCESRREPARLLSGP
jgi:NAD(P)-dependent dehydrogenase (short-subunit alcohol dehydrogenase family)